MAKTSKRVDALERQLAELRDDLDRLTTLHLRQAVVLIEVETALETLRADHAREADRADVDAVLAQLVGNLADVRRRLPA